MSRKKRRKTSKKQKEKDIDDFRREVVDLICFESWRREMIGRESMGRESYMWNWNSVKKEHEEEYEKMGSEEKISKILTSSDLKLQKMLKDILKSYLMDVFKKYSRKGSKISKGMGKEILIVSIVRMFRGSEADEMKRIMEKDNLGEDVAFVSITLCHIDVPRELVLHIFSFFVYNIDLITTVGSISKEFYLTVLSTWRSLEITKKNIWSISLLVLQNVKKITICERLVKKDILHLFTTLSKTQRLKELHFRSKRGYGITKQQANVEFVKSFFSTHKNFLKKKRSKKTTHPVVSKNPFQNVNRLSLLDCRQMPKKEFDYDNIKKKLGSFHLSEIFPSLRILDEPLHLPMLSESHNISENIRELTLTLIRSYWLQNLPEKKFYFVYNSASLQDLISRMKSLKKLNLRGVVLRQGGEGDCFDQMKRILDSSEKDKLTTLNIELCKSTIINGEYDLSFLLANHLKLVNLKISLLNYKRVLKRSTLLLEFPKKMEFLETLVISNLPAEEIPTFIFSDYTHLRRVKMILGFGLENFVDDFYTPMLERVCDAFNSGSKLCHLELVSFYFYPILEKEYITCEHARWNGLRILMNKPGRKLVLSRKDVKVEKKNRYIPRFHAPQIEREDILDHETSKMFKIFLERFAIRVSEMIMYARIQNEGEFVFFDVSDFRKEVAFGFDENKFSISMEDNVEENKRVFQIERI